MSDYWIIVIPESADFIPSDEAKKKVIQLFRQLAPTADEVTSKATPNIRFIDCGGNFERVLCPACSSEIDVHWWQDWLQKEADAGYPLREAELPCCHTKQGINKLKYDWPQGFARFSVAAMNPGISDLSVENIKEFESLLECKVRKVRRHI